MPTVLKLTYHSKCIHCRLEYWKASAKLEFQTVWKILTPDAVWGINMCHHAKYHPIDHRFKGCGVLQMCFQHANRPNFRILLFWTFPISRLTLFWTFQNSNSFLGGQYVSSCHISSKSVELLQWYGHLTVFKMAVIHHLEFWKFNFFKQPGWLRNPHCTSIPNFMKIGQTVVEMSQFLWFQDDGRTTLDFQKFEF